jgi:hypothetical protein
MTAEDIMLIIEIHNPQAAFLKFDLHPLCPVFGIVAVGPDYKLLKMLNVWRVVKQSDIITWYQTHDLELTELINGELIMNISVIN